MLLRKFSQSLNNVLGLVTLPRPEVSTEASQCCLKLLSLGVECATHVLIHQEINLSEGILEAVISLIIPLSFVRLQFIGQVVDLVDKPGH